MAIRYDKKLENEINRTIRNFNQKISRLEKSERELLLPQKVSKKELKQELFTRTDLRKRLKELQQFSKIGVEETIKTEGGVSISRYELEKLKRETRQVKRKLTKDINFYSKTTPSVLGQKQFATFAQMGDQYYLNLIAKRNALNKGDISKLTPKEFERFKRLIEKSQKNITYYNHVFRLNYIKILNELGYYFDYDTEKIKILENKLMSLSDKNFIKLFRNEKSIQAILDYYLPRIQKGMLDPDVIKDDVRELYDNLIDNIDIILKDYN